MPTSIVQAACSQASEWSHSAQLFVVKIFGQPGNHVLTSWPTESHWITLIHASSGHLYMLHSWESVNFCSKLEKYFLIPFAPCISCPLVAYFWLDFQSDSCTTTFLRDFPVPARATEQFFQVWIDKNRRSPAHTLRWKDQLPHISVESRWEEIWVFTIPELLRITRILR